MFHCEGQIGGVWRRSCGSTGTEMGGRASRELSESQQAVKRLTSELQVWMTCSEFLFRFVRGAKSRQLFACPWSAGRHRHFDKKTSGIN
jgi:hypothetical protein